MILNFICLAVKIFWFTRTDSQKVVQVRRVYQLLFSSLEPIIEISVALNGGNTGTPPPEIGKIDVENWCYLPEVILSELRQKSKKF